jgi:MFS family permease
MPEPNPYESPKGIEPSSAAPHSVFGLPDFRRMMVSIACSTMAGQALALVTGYQVYEITGSKLAIGILGLVEAIPAITLSLYGGHVADRHDRRRILIITTSLLTLCAGLLVASSYVGVSLVVLYITMFVVGVGRSFAGPALSALEAQVVPINLIVKSAIWFSSTWLTAAVVGPLVGGFAIAYFGPMPTYVIIAALYAIAWLASIQISPQPHVQPKLHESVWQSITSGVAYVFSNQPLLGSMSLDLFAVLFGGVMALLPVFAKEILFVDAFHLGFLRAAPHTGALVTMLIATRHPPVRHAGRNLLFAVAAFGVTILVFAVSNNFYLSLAMLFLSGVFDGISVVIRRAIVRLLSPNYLRGRIAAVSLIFIGSSNELGALESGLAAAWLGTIPSVLAGGTVTLLVAAVTAWLAPRLRSLRLDNAAAHLSEDDQVELANEASQETAEKL